MNIYKQAVEKFGTDAQLIVAIEELSELQKAITKYLRGKQHNIEEEMEDVRIMLRQLDEMTDVVNQEKSKKWEAIKIHNLKNLIK
ncbi:nucleoside triphosphate pyrophosphohydrolase family protein [Tepidibacter mesophilus]|uniref:hypothetical protein n=1 Tax=Tepidibacter mesophilus TaxID=655607 RepID=UPI000C089AF4|nr:hypothetical protein [Tepidibacter mesophilus]